MGVDITRSLMGFEVMSCNMLENWAWDTIVSLCDSTEATLCI